MSELEDRINSVLNDPEQMEKITRLAKNIMGDAEPAGNGLDPAMLSRLSSALSGGGGGKSAAVLEALKPYLSEKRRGKVDRAIRLARLAGIARLAMNEDGGAGDV